MTATIGILEEISRRCLSGEALSLDQAGWLAKAMRRFLTRQCRTIEEAFGVISDRGGVSWRMEQAMRQRDAALVQLARRYLADQSISAQARAIHRMCTRYAACAWRSDRDLHEMPMSYAGAPKEFLWRAFSAGAPMPIGERRLRMILPKAERSK